LVVEVADKVVEEITSDPSTADPPLSSSTECMPGGSCSSKGKYAKSMVDLIYLLSCSEASADKWLYNGKV
jgi:hypothetical protein